MQKGLKYSLKRNLPTFRCYSCMLVDNSYLSIFCAFLHCFSVCCGKRWWNAEKMNSTSKFHLKQLIAGWNTQQQCINPSKIARGEARSTTKSKEKETSFYLKKICNPIFVLCFKTWKMCVVVCCKHWVFSIEFSCINQ